MMPDDDPQLDSQPNVDVTEAEATAKIAGGQPFNIGGMRVRMKTVLRGSPSDIHGAMIWKTTHFCQMRWVQTCPIEAAGGRCFGDWKIGAYRDATYEDPTGPLVAVFLLERLA